MTKLDKESYERVIDALEAADGEPFQYTGRGCGSPCVAVKCYEPMGWLMDFAAATARNAADADEAADVIEALGHPQSDSFGRDSRVLYFPAVAWQESEDDADDEEGDAKVTVNTEDYTGGHGHDPGGEGEWMFSFGEEEEQECPDSFAGLPHFSHNGTYAQAKKAAVAHARELGMPTVFVLG